MNIAIIFLLIGVLIIIAILLALLIDPTLTTTVPKGLGTLCSQTADCRAGLICAGSADPNYNNPTCLIPELGSCYWSPDYCAGGYTCYNGACVSSLIPLPEEPPSTANPSRLMSPDTDPEVVQMKQDFQLPPRPSFWPISLLRGAR